MPPQWGITEPALMEGVERMNVVMVRGQEQGIEAPRRDSYVMEVDRGRNCYTCRGFRYMAQHCKNQGRGRVVKKRKLEYRGGEIEGNIKHLDNLKGMENLESLD